MTLHDEFKLEHEALSVQTHAQTHQKGAQPGRHCRAMAMHPEVKDVMFVVADAASQTPRGFLLFHPEKMTAWCVRASVHTCSIRQNPVRSCTDRLGSIMKTTDVFKYACLRDKNDVSHR